MLCAGAIRSGINTQWRIRNSSTRETQAGDIQKILPLVFPNFRPNVVSWPKGRYFILNSLHRDLPQEVLLVITNEIVFLSIYILFEFPTM